MRLPDVHRVLRPAAQRPFVVLALVAFVLVTLPATTGTAAQATVSGSSFVPLTPCRVLDTRSNAAPLAPTVPRNAQVAGSGSDILAQGGHAGGCGVPSDATAVEVSVTAVTPTGDGYLRVWPSGQGVPNATFVNYTGGQSTTNTGAVTRAAGSPDLTLESFVSSTHVVVDVQGYYTSTGAGSGYVPLTPCRLMDTRASASPLTPLVPRDVQVAGSGAAISAQGGTPGGCGVPLDATAVQLSVSAVGPSGPGFVRAWPGGEGLPNATFVNYSAGQSTTNSGAVTRSLSSPDLQVQSYVNATDVVIDVQGYFTSGGGALYVPLTPCRVVDTRATSAMQPAVTRSFQTATPASAIASQGGNAAGCGVPSDASAVEAAVSAVNPVGPGFVRVWPQGQGVPNATFVNFTGGRSTTNTVAITRSAATCIATDLAASSFVSATQLVVDVQGYFTSAAAAPPTVCGFSRVVAPSPAPSSPRAPALVGLSWSVDDPNGDPLTCQLDADGNGTFESTFPSCTSGNSFATLSVPGSVTPVLRVSDGTTTVDQSAASVVVAAAPSDSSFDIDLRNVGPALSTSVEAAFDAARSRWHGIIVKGVPSLTLSQPLPSGSCGLTGDPGLAAGTVIDDLQIDLVVHAIDGPGGVLGAAGPCITSTADGLPRYGIMEFDVADMSNLESNGTLTAVITHEMGHVLGYGTMWSDQRSLAVGAGTPLTAYTGPLGTTAYALLGGSGNVPLETGGGAGTADSHWSEARFGNELMTGYINATNRLSALTIASMADLGYQVDLAQADAYTMPLSALSALLATTDPRAAPLLGDAALRR